MYENWAWLFISMIIKNNLQKELQIAYNVNKYQNKKTINFILRITIVTCYGVL